MLGRPNAPGIFNVFLDLYLIFLRVLCSIFYPILESVYFFQWCSKTRHLHTILKIPPHYNGPINPLKTFGRCPNSTLIGIYNDFSACCILLQSVMYFSTFYPILESVSFFQWWCKTQGLSSVTQLQTILKITPYYKRSTKNLHFNWVKTQQCLTTW